MNSLHERWGYLPAARVLATNLRWLPCYTAKSYFKILAFVERH